jgi:hypothetical protein
VDLAIDIDKMVGIIHTIFFTTFKDKETERKKIPPIIRYVWIENKNHFPSFYFSSKQ